MMINLIAALAMGAGAPAAVTKAAADAQCKAGQSAPSGKVSDWKDGLHDGKGGLTPATVPGATRVSVDEMMCLSKAYGDRFVGLTPIEAKESGIPGTWRVDRGWEAGEFLGNAQEVVVRQLHYTVGTDLDRPILVYCHNTYCFMSYNLAIRAARAGYRNIYWLRGGMEEWQGKGGKLQPLLPAIMAVGKEPNEAMMCYLYSTALVELKVLTEKQYEAYAGALTQKLEKALPQPARGDLYEDHLAAMEENVAGDLEAYQAMIASKNPDAVAFRKETFGEYDRICGGIAGTPTGLFPN